MRVCFFITTPNCRIRLFSKVSCFCGKMACLDGKMVKSFTSHVRFQDTTSKIMWVQMSSLLRVFFTQENNLVSFKNQRFRIPSLCGYRSIVYWQNLMSIDSSGLLLITLSVYCFWRAVHKTYHLLTTSSHAHNVSSHKWRHCSLLGKCIILQWTNKQPQNVHKRWLKRSGLWKSQERKMDTHFRP